MSAPFSASLSNSADPVSAQFQQVASASEIVPGNGKTIQINGHEIALFNLDGSFYAIDNRCPHRGAPLSDGYLHADKVLCNWHCFDFSLKTGACEIVPELRVTTYEVKVEGGMIYVRC